MTSTFQFWWLHLQVDKCFLSCLVGINAVQAFVADGYGVEMLLEVCVIKILILINDINLGVIVVLGVSCDASHSCVCLLMSCGVWKSSSDGAGGLVCSGCGASFYFSDSTSPSGPWFHMRHTHHDMQDSCGAYAPGHNLDSFSGDHGWWHWQILVTFALTSVVIVYFLLQQLQIFGLL